MCFRRRSINTLQNSTFTVFPSGMNSLCTTPSDSKKLSTWSCPLEFQFLWTRGCLINPFKTLSLCFGIIGKTPGLISCNNFVKKIICISHCNNVLARCDSIFPLLRCQGMWKKTCTQLSLSQILFQNLKNVLGMFKDLSHF